MIDINLLRENPEIITKDLEKRKDKEKLKWVDEVKQLDGRWREAKQDADNLRHERNEATLQIQKLKKEGKQAKEEIKNAGELSQGISRKEAELQDLRDKIDNYLMRLPNIMHKTVPTGDSAEDNAVIRKEGKTEKPGFELKSHSELIENLADFDRATKIAGAGFYFMKGELAMLNQALIRFTVDMMLKKGFMLVQVPLMMRKEPYEGVTDLRDFANVMYKIDGEELYMIATSEHPMTAMFMNETIEEKELPVKMLGVSPCFRKEIGSHGVDTRGLFRVHQFDKVEQVVICKPEDSWRLHEEMLANAEQIFKKLKLPYRVVNICSGDIGTVAAKKYDIEAWFAKQQAYKEVVSCSNCTDYQARRLNIKHGKQGGSKELVHTLNSTAVATSRVLAVIIENNQKKNGSIKVPTALVPYMGGIKEINRR